MTEWRPFPGYPDYEISRDGRARRVTPPRDGRKQCLALPYELRASVNLFGYRLFNMTARNGRRRMFLAHRAVAFAFLGPPPTPRHVVAHNDGTPGHDAVENLRWATMLENQRDMFAHGTAQIGELATGHKLTAADVAEIRRRGREPRKKLAAQFGVTPMHIGRIVLRQTWRHHP